MTVSQIPKNTPGGWPAEAGTDRALTWLEDSKLGNAFRLAVLMAASVVGAAGLSQGVNHFEAATQPHAQAQVAGPHHPG
jgi:hypothetical protein